MRPTTPALFILLVLLMTLTFSSQLNFDVKFEGSTDFTSFEIIIFPGSTFKKCLCIDLNLQTCNRIVTKSGSSNTKDYNITQDIFQISNRKGIPYFVCSVTSPDTWGTQSLSCIPQTGDICTTNLCSVNIIIGCTNKNVTLIWTSTQQARVYNTSETTLVNCCTVTETTTVFPSTINSTPTTTISSTMRPLRSTITSVTTTVISPTSPTEKPTILNTTTTFPETSSSATTTMSTNIFQPIQDQQNEPASTQISGVHIGIIIGTAIAAILITILIMCLIWRIKTGHKNNHERRNQPNRTNHDSVNQENTTSEVVRNKTNGNKQHQKHVGLAPSIVALREGKDEYSHISQDYNYIDIVLFTSLGNSTANNNVTIELLPNPSNSTANNNVTSELLQNPSNSTANNNVTSELLQNPSNNTALKIIADEGHDVYSHLRENKVTLDNPYNCTINEQNNGINNSTNFSGSSQGTNQRLEKDITHQNTNHKLSPASGNKIQESEEILPIHSDNYTEINPKTKLKNRQENAQPAARQQKDNYDLQCSDNLILQQSTPNNTDVDTVVSRPCIREPYDIDSGNLNSTPVYSNYVYSSEKEMGLSIAVADEETEYVNVV